MAYPPTLPPVDRTDTTVAAGNHAADHNSLTQALAAIVDVLGPDPTGPDYDTLTERLAATLESALSRPGRILAEAIVGPAGPFTGATMVDVDATNAKVTFTAPLSGAVWVDLEGIVKLANTAVSSGLVVAVWGLRNGTTVIAQSSALTLAGGVAVTDGYLTLPTRFRLTGLTPGTSYTYKWGTAITGDPGSTQLLGGSMRVLEALAP